MDSQADTATEGTETGSMADTDTDWSHLTLHLAAKINK